MKTNILFSALLLLGSLSWIGFTGASATTNANGCVVDEDGKPMIYVDIMDADGKLLLQTDVKGCFSLEQHLADQALTLYFPGYEPLPIAATASQANYTLLKINHLPPVYQPEKGMVYPTESRGEHRIRGTVVDDEGAPLIGASLLIIGTTTGTVTDVDGSFTLRTTTECAQVTVSYTGFETQEFKELCEGKEHRLALKAGAPLDEVVVTGLGAERSRKDRTHGIRRRSAADAWSSSPPPPPPPAPPAVYSAIIPASSREGRYSDDTRSSVPSDFSARTAAPASATVTRKEAEEAFMRGEPVSAASETVTKGGADATADLPDAGQLTAGEINDFSKWDMWADISQEDLGQYRSHWQQYADHRYTLQLTTPTGAAVVNAIATLEDGQGNALWQARTDAQGRAELWAHYFRDVATPANGLSILIEYEGKKQRINQAKPFPEGINFETFRTECREDAVVDIAFVVDATGSMGDEISYLQAELLDVIDRVRTGLPGVDLQMGSVFYRDHNEEYLTRVQPFTKDDATAVTFLKQQSAQGGGDYPEAVEAALESALDSLAWRDQASTRLLFLVLDAPPHQAEENIKRLQVAITKAAQRGIQIIPVSCSGVDKNTEFLLRSMALATNGTYTFITDHSGIGNSHIEPSTDAYEVEHLNDVLARLSIERSQLSTCALPVAAVDTEPVTSPDERDWSYYPNPTSGPLTLTFTEADTGVLYLADAQGKLLLQRQSQAQFDLDLSRYPAGTYWLRHEAANGAWTEGQVLLLVR